MKSMTSKNISVADRIMVVIGKKPATAEQVRGDLKDKFGYNIKPKDIRVNLLYLLRREKI